MEKTIIGQKISSLRRERGWTQEELSEKLNVSPQAVSKWENDISYPDITLLPQLAKLFGVTTDELLGCEKPAHLVKVVPEGQRKDISDLVVRLVVNSAAGDRVRVNLPMTMLKMGIEVGMSMPEISGAEALKAVDFEKICEMAEKGLLGQLVEVESADGGTVRIFVEEI